MNRLSIIFMFVFAFGLIASNASAADAMHVVVQNNIRSDFHEVSPAEFFYGVSINNNETMQHPQALRTEAERPESAQQAYDALSAPEFFSGYPVPARLETTATNHGVVCNEGAAPLATLSEVSNPAIFFGYTDVNTNKGFCDNC